MRRRQAFAAQTAAREAALLTVGTPFKPQPIVQFTAGEMKDACPKCGKVVTRGKFMHQKHCRGSAT